MQTGHKRIRLLAAAVAALAIAGTAPPVGAQAYEEPVGLRL